MDPSIAVGDNLIWAVLLAVAFLIFLSAFFSASESAVTASSRPRMHALEKDGSRRAGLVNRLLDARDRLIGAILIASNLVNVLASALMTGLLIALFGDEGVLYATLIMTVLIVLLTDLLPKTYAFYNADRVALALAPLLRGIVLVLTPFADVCAWIVRGSLRVFGVDMNNSAHHESDMHELRGAIDLHKSEEGEASGRRAMLRSILDLEEVQVSEIMVHRSKVVAIDLDQPNAAIVDQVLNSSHTRLPLWADSPDNIVGIIHAKWLLRAIQNVRGDLDRLDIRAIMADPWFIPDTTSLLDQLEAFRARREHFALVIDEYGTFMGVVTLEDILEEIVGQIDDEHDRITAGVRKLAGGTYMVRGDVTIRDLNRDLEWELPDDQDYATVAGLVLFEARTLPAIGQSFHFYGFRFDIVRRDGNRITQIRITPSTRD